VTESPQAVPLTRPAAEDFLYREAALLDSWQLDEWLTLFSQETPPLYWIPGSDDETDPTLQTSILYDDRKRTEERVWRLLKGPAHAQIPRSKTRRMISNVMVAALSPDRAAVTSCFSIHESRKDQQRVFVGQYLHHLVLEAGSWRIAMKKVQLLNNDQPIFNLSFVV
jgi:benzoate/toluate 1,2-dioxygenase beta subunit